MSQEKVKRGNWGSRIGFLLTIWFASIGIGNMWRFPFRCATNGGGAFLLPYLLCIMFISIPAVMAESGAGKLGQSDPANTFQKVAGLRGLGYVTILLNLFAAYYIVVVSQSLYWLYKAAANTFATETSEVVWTSFMDNKSLCLGVFALTLVLSALPNLFGIQKGIERVAKYFGGFAFIIIVIGAIRAVMMPGALAGVSYFLTPNWSVMFKGSTLSAALSQSYFTYGAGWGWYLITSSYLKKHADVGKAQINTGFADTTFALLAGFAIIPTLFAAGYTAENVGSLGASTAYVAMPKVFMGMPGAYIVSLLFFLALFIAAYSCAYVLVEVVASFFIDSLKMSRVKGVLFSVILLFLCGAAPSMNPSMLTTIDDIFGCYVLPALVTMQVYGIGWKYGGERLRMIAFNTFGNGYIGKWFTYIYKFFVPTVNIFLMVYFAKIISDGGAPWYLGWGGLSVVLVIVLGVTFGIHSYDRKHGKLPSSVM